MLNFDSLPTEIKAANQIKFMFDPGVDNTFLTDKINRRNTLAGRLDKLINEPTIGGHPFIKYILQHVPSVDPEELRVVSRALERIADLWEPFQKIDSEVKGLIFAKSNPSLVALAFGAFDVPHDADSFLDLTNKPTKDTKES